MYRAELAYTFLGVATFVAARNKDKITVYIITFVIVWFNN